MASSRRVTIAVLVGLGAFALYFSTLLPGFDFGDTPSFQVMAGSAAITPRDGYPLYFAFGSLFTWLTPDPAYALNLASAAAAAIGCGLTALLAFELSGSLLASITAAVAFGGSYTFWSQSVIAEVYALHIALVALTLLLLLHWEQRPGVGRLALFFAAYAAAFGNHLSMILLLPGCTLFLLLAAPGGWRRVVTPRIIVLAAGIAAVAAFQYWWNLRTLWLLAQPPSTLTEALRTFWFDVTKSDWRDTMVLEVPPSMTLERIRMYGFDLMQQFGWLFPAVAVVGFYRLARQHGTRAVLLGAAFAVNLIFALGYSVGDSHVFFLPSHLMIALLVAPGLVHLEHLVAGLIAATTSSTIVRTAARRLVLLLALAVAGVHLYREYPALDRSGDRRPQQLLDALAAGLTDRNAVLFTDLNWQVQNGLTYYAAKTRTNLAVAGLNDVLLYAPALFADNHAIDRDVVVTTRARDRLITSYGPLFAFDADERASAPRLSDIVQALAPGSRYVLCVLRPTRDFVIDGDDLTGALTALTNGHPPAVPSRDYVAVTGIAGEPVPAVVSGDRPFRHTAVVGGVAVDLRMESWLAFDTIRRMGFGQVVVGRQHTLVVERGVSFAAFEADGRPIQTAYSANIFAPQRRWRVVPQ
jgi:hypothetical protein